MLYSLIRPLLFLLPPETAHHATLKTLSFLAHYKLLPASPVKQSEHLTSIMGLTFPNPVGLAAGLDKNGEHIDALATLGFGFIEIGTVTPRPQPGNPKPRLFRLPEAQALINRMGFNNHGVDNLIEHIKSAKFKGILGINIGKNFDTPLEKAVEDYVICMEKIYVYASYIVINISSPNTPGLRQLQYGQELTDLLQTLKATQTRLQKQHQKYVPLAVKISPDLTEEEIQKIASILIAQNIDAVISSNTTLSREGVETFSTAKETGGLSGKPLFETSLRNIGLLHRALNKKIPIIACGGIMHGKDAEKMLAAGADLVQIYTGLIYRGSALIKECASACNKLNNDFKAISKGIT